MLNNLYARKLRLYSGIKCNFLVSKTLESQIKSRVLYKIGHHEDNRKKHFFRSANEWLFVQFALSVWKYPFENILLGFFDRKNFHHHWRSNQASLCWQVPMGPSLKLLDTYLSHSFVPKNCSRGYGRSIMTGIASHRGTTPTYRHSTRIWLAVSSVKEYSRENYVLSKFGSLCWCTFKDIQWTLLNMWRHL